MTASRPLPQPGAPVRIWHFSGESEAATIVEVREGGRCLVIAGADGATREFTLRRGNAMFVARGEQFSPHVSL